MIGMKLMKTKDIARERNHIDSQKVKRLGQGYLV